MDIFSVTKEFLYQYISGPYERRIVTVILLAGIALSVVVAYYLCKGMMVLLGHAVNKSRTTWDDDLLNDSFMRAVSQLAPALIVNWLLPGFFSANTGSVRWMKILTSFYILWAAIWIVIIFINNLYRAFLRRENMRAYAIKGVFQMMKLIMIGVGVIIGISIIIDKSPIAILTALGASAAILMLVFKDTILGLVASVQLTANKMLHRGDWIVADKHGANGEVEDVSLTTVKVRNWDNSISTIPPYALITESFRNYQPMRDSGGRRVDRSIYIDVNSVRFLTAPELEHLRSLGWLDGLEDCGEDARAVVNLTLLRNYLERYLTSHPEVVDSMLLMVRQMQPTQAGLPLQLYFFTRRTVWKEFEKVQSDIFDHVYAIIHEFGLDIFQSPAGLDVKHLKS